MDYNQRFNILKGQIDGIKKMILDQRDCVQVIHQIKAVKSSLNQLSRKYIENSLKDCFNAETMDTEKLDKILKLIY